MKFKEYEEIFNNIIKKELSEENKKKKIEPLLVKYKYHFGILYKGFFHIYFSYRTKKENFINILINLLKVLNEDNKK
jgi:hypothetical protein